MNKFIAGIVVALAAAVSPAGAAPTTGATEVQAADLFGAKAQVKPGELAAITGRADVNLEVRAQNTSNVSNNSVTGQSQTGTISFDSQAFANLNGLSLLSANTGNNVAINSSLNVNVAIQR